jgi:xanthine dehydrogenase accessory factor
MPNNLPHWPLFGLTDDVRPALGRAVAREAPAALATIVALADGGPRPLGAQMCFSGGEVSGFLSGGCLEADLAGHAEEVLADGEPRHLVYGEGSPWPDIRLMCGARIEILVERLPPGDPAARALLAATDARAPALWLSDGRRRLCASPEAAPGSWPGTYVRRYDPVPRLVVVGSDPTALAIAALGRQTGFETCLVRPKGPADPPRGFEGLRYLRDEPAAAFAAVGLDPWTAVAVASHDAALDHAALLAALPSPASYVGALGARRRLDDRLAGLRAAGLSSANLARLRSPIGLDIGGKAPWEVALAVLAEITALRHARATGSDSDQSRSRSRISTASPAPAAGASAARRRSA